MLSPLSWVAYQSVPLMAGLGESVVVGSCRRIEAPRECMLDKTDMMRKWYKMALGKD